MKKFLCVFICLVTVVTLFAGCKHSENTVNRLLFDTAVTLTAECERSVLLEAVSLCEGYENLLSRTKEGSDVYKINNSEGFVSVSEETALIIKTALKYYEVEVLDETQVAYKCNCSRERVEKALISMGKKDLLEMAAEQESTNIECHFCDKNYSFSAHEIRELAGK